MQDKIYIKGARENNLKNVDVEIPRGHAEIVGQDHQVCGRNINSPVFNFLIMIGRTAQNSGHFLSLMALADYFGVTTDDLLGRE